MQNQIFSKDVLYKELLDCLIEALGKGETTDEEGSASASVISEGVEKIQNQDEALIFLESLVVKWPTYSPVLLKAKGTEQRVEDAAKIDKVVTELQNINS